MEENRTGVYLAVEIVGHEQRFSVSPNQVCRIGRNADNDIVIDHHSISRNHAVIQGSVGSFLIFDLGSRNGTLVNGRRLQGVEFLQNGDRISIGGIELTFHQAGQDGTPEAGFSSSPSTNVDLARGLVTVLVVDIRDSTALARRLDPDKFSQVIGSLFREAGKILHTSGAWAQKYIGDAVMAVWLHQGDDLKVGREMLSVMDGLLRVAEIACGLQRRFELSTPVRIGAGVNSGWASIGNVGSTAAADFTATGEVVHKAFRLESATRESGYDLLVSNDTLNLLLKSGRFGDVFHECSVTLKGYNQAVDACGVTFAELRNMRET